MNSSPLTAILSATLVLRVVRWRTSMSARGSIIPECHYLPRIQLASQHHVPRLSALQSAQISGSYP
jgi:hypothetical protein